MNVEKATDPVNVPCMVTLPTEIKTILFDLDGTIIDTELAAAAAIERTYAGWGIQLDRNDAQYITGRTWAKAFEFLFEKYPPPIPRDRASATMMESYRKGIEQDLVVVPESVEAVRSMSRDFPLGLVSGSNRSEILWALGHLGILDLFSVVLGAEDYPNSKPAPDGYQKAIAALKADAASTLIFEDSNAGIRSALACGAWVVAITGTNHFSQDTSAAHASIRDFSGIRSEWVRKLSLTQRK